MWKKYQLIILPAISAFLGAASVLIYFHFNPKDLKNRARGIELVDTNDKSLDVKLNSIIHDQEKLFRNFDDVFNNNFFQQGDPFEEMRRFRREINKHFHHDEEEIFPFDSWFSGKFGGGSIKDIKKREDENFLYYDVDLPGLAGASLKTDVTDGYLTITGEINKSNGNNSHYRSTFRRTFPLPDNIDIDKMEIDSQKDRVTLKFPKIHKSITE